MQCLDLESNTPSSEYTDDVKEIRSVSLIKEICSSYICTLLIQVFLTKKKLPSYKSNKYLDRLSGIEIIQYCQIYILQCHCSLVIIKVFRHWDVYQVRRKTTFCILQQHQLVEQERQLLIKVNISKICIFMEIREKRNSSSVGYGILIIWSNPVEAFDGTRFYDVPYAENSSHGLCCSQISI